MIATRGMFVSEENKHSDFYRAFEEKFRGSRSLIRSRLEIYTPFLHAVAQVDGNNTGVDLGCGRGEWLELLADNGFAGIGVDLDNGMLQVSRERGLNVINGDAIDFLRMQKSNSFNVVTGFHIAEHIPFEQLQILINESHRILRPGGLLILETPNPENYRVSSLTFYLDPTHRNPIPPVLLHFMTEYYGFAQCKIMRLQEAENIGSLVDVTLEQALGGASPDYSVIAQKSGSEDIINLVRTLFEKDYGVEQGVLMNKFERRLQQSAIGYKDIASGLNKLRSMHQNLSELMEKKTVELSGIIQNEREAIDHLASQISSVRNDLSDCLQSERKGRQMAEEALSATYASTSWRITAPLRTVSRGLRWFRDGVTAWFTFRPGSRPRRIVRRVLLHAVLWVRMRPRVAKLAMHIVQKVPKIERRLRDLQASIYTHGRATNLAIRPTDLAQSRVMLSPRGRAVLADVREHKLRR